MVIARITQRIKQPRDLTGVVNGSGVARGECKLAPLFLEKMGHVFFIRENGTRVLYQLFAKQNTSYFSQRSFVNIDSNDFDKAGYEADILSTYFHDDR